MEETNGILKDIRVLDFGRYIAGPYCGALLSDYGAEVIRIERTDGSEDRYVSPVCSNGDGAMFLQMNRNKLGLTLNPKKEEGKDIIKKLVETADVVIANLPEPTLISMNLDYESLAEINERIILTSNTAFGTSGPYSNKVGFDGVAQAMSGAMDMTGTNETPGKAYAPYVDFCSASLAAFGTVLAILERFKSGKGQRVQTSLLTTALTMTNSLVIEEKLTNVNRSATLNRSQTSAPADTFKTKNGWILITTVGQPLFERWCDLIGESEWLHDERFKDDISRGNNGHLISNRMALWCGKRTTEEAIAELDNARIPVGEILKAADTLNHSQIKSRQLFKSVAYPGNETEVPIVMPPVELSSNPGLIRFRAPTLGEHTVKLLKELGYTQAQILTLQSSGVI